MKHVIPILTTLTLLAACDSPPAAVAEQAPPAHAQRLFSLGDMQPLAMESTGTGEASTGTTTGVIDAADAPDLGDGSSSSTTGIEPVHLVSCKFPYNEPEVGDALCPDSDCMSPNDFRNVPPWVPLEVIDEEFGGGLMPTLGVCPTYCDPTTMYWTAPECEGMRQAYPDHLVECVHLAADHSVGVCLPTCPNGPCPADMECWAVWPGTNNQPGQVCFPLWP